MFNLQSVFLKLALSTCLPISALLLTACTGSSSSSSSEVITTELDLAITQAVDHTVIPAANNFQVQGKALNDLAVNFCSTDTLSENNLLTLQQQWRLTTEAWYQLLPYNFGPLEASLLFPAYTFIDSYRLRGTDYTETMRNEIDQLLSSQEVLNAETFSQKTFNKVGLLALEISLFETASDQSKEAGQIVSEYNSDVRKCQLLTGYSAELLRRANIIQQGWTSNYRETGKSYRYLLINGQLENVLNDEVGGASFNKLTIALQAYYDYLAKRDVTTETGQISVSIWSSIEKSLDITQAILEGNVDTNISLYRLMSNNGHEASATIVKENIQTLRLAVNEQNTVDMKAAAAALDGNFKREIPAALNINLGLNFSDGD